MAHTHNIEVYDGPAIVHRKPYIGTTFKGNVTAFIRNGAPLDISADTFDLYLYDEDGATELHHLTLGSGIEFDGGDGIIWTFTPLQTADFVRNAKLAYLLLWTEDATSDVWPIIAGSVTPQKYLNI